MIRQQQLHQLLPCWFALICTIITLILTTISCEQANAFQQAQNAAYCHHHRRKVNPYNIPHSFLSKGHTVSSRSRLYLNENEDAGELPETSNDDQQVDKPAATAVKAEDLPWFDFSYVQESLSDDDEDSNSTTRPLPLFTSSLIFVVSIVGTLYLYYVGLTSL